MLYCEEHHNVWVIKEPTALEALGVYGSQTLEQGLLVALGDYLGWAEEIP
jgi:hypothetical protein